MNSIAETVVADKTVVEQKLYFIWYNLVRRCHQHGVSISRRWEINAKAFVDDMWESYVFAKYTCGFSKISLTKKDIKKPFGTGNAHFVEGKMSFDKNKSDIGAGKYEAISPDGHRYRFNNQANFAKQHGILHISNMNKALHHGGAVQGWRFLVLQND